MQEQEKQLTSLYIALPAYGQTVFSQTAGSLFKLAQHLTAFNVLASLGTVSIIDIVEVRNVFLSIFFDKTKASHLLFIDADMSFPSELIMDMIRFDKPLVGAVYPAKVFPPKFVGRAIGEAPYDIDSGFIKVDGVGAGIMLIRRDCVEKLLDADPELSVPPCRGHIAAPLIDQIKLDRIICAFNPIITEGYRRSEDLSFCYRWRSLGEDIWANVSHDIGHTGPHTFCSRFLEIASNEPAPQEQPAIS